MTDPCADFRLNPTVNPRTGKKIQVGGPTYNSLVKECGTPTTINIGMGPISEIFPRYVGIPPLTPFPTTVPMPTVTGIRPTVPTLRVPSPKVPTVTTIPTMRVPSLKIPTVGTIPTIPRIPTAPKIPTVVTGRPSSPKIPTITEIIQPMSPPKISPDIMEDLPTIPGFNPTEFVEKSVTAWTIQNVNSLIWGARQRQQRGHEDIYQGKRIGPFDYYAVFDGHGGPKQLGPEYEHVAGYAADHFHEKLAEKLYTVDYIDQDAVKTAISEAFVEFDRDMHDKEKLFGSTCTVVLVDTVRNLIYQANLGDSRSIIFEGNNIISATVDHKPTDTNERTRVANAGGFVVMGRVQGMLAVARAFGDFDLKANNDITYDPVNGMVSAVPDVKVIQQEPPFWIILTSDAPFERNAHTNESLVSMCNDINIGMTRTFTRDPEDKLVVEVEPGYYAGIANNMVLQITPKTTDDTTIIVARYE